MDATINRVYAEFITFVSQSPNRYRSLCDYANEWIEHGNAIRLAKGDFARFLAGFIYAVDYFTKHRADFGENGQHITAIIGVAASERCLDPEEWDRAVRRRRYRRPKSPGS